MNLRNRRVLLGLTIAAIFTSFGCEKSAPDNQTLKAQSIKLGLAHNADLAAVADGISLNLWTVTINPGAAAHKCTADTPWQELYARADTTENDQIRFKSGTPGQAYQVTFLFGMPLVDGNGNPTNTIPVPANGFSSIFAVNPNLSPMNQCKSSTGACAFPYKIALVPDGTVLCNDGNAPPDGSDGIVIKGG